MMTKTKTTPKIDADTLRLPRIEIITQKFGNGFRTVKYPVAVCTLKPETGSHAAKYGYPVEQFEVSYAKLQQWLKAGLVAPPSEEWYRKRGGGERYISFYLPVLQHQQTGQSGGAA